MSDDRSGAVAPHYADGTWTEVPDELSRSWPDGADSDEALRLLGYREWARVGDPYAMDVPLTLGVYCREKAPQFYMSVEGNTFGDIHHVYARALPDLMDLLAKWTPALQAAAVTDLLRQLGNPQDGGASLTTLRELLGHDR